MKAKVTVDIFRTHPFTISLFTSKSRKPRAKVIADVVYVDCEELPVDCAPSSSDPQEYSFDVEMVEIVEHEGRVICNVWTSKKQEV